MDAVRLREFAEKARADRVERERVFREKNGFDLGRPYYVKIDGRWSIGVASSTYFGNAPLWEVLGYDRWPDVDEVGDLVEIPEKYR